MNWNNEGTQICEATLYKSTTLVEQHSIFDWHGERIISFYAWSNDAELKECGTYNTVAIWRKKETK